MDDAVENPFSGGDEFTAEVVQYIRPLGRPVNTSTRLNVKVQPLYQEMLKNKCRFEAEVLRTDEVSLTISRKGFDLDIEVVSNGPEVQAAMERLLERRSWALSEDDLAEDGDPDQDPENSKT